MESTLVLWQPLAALEPIHSPGVTVHLGVDPPSGSRCPPEILECQVKWALGSITTNKASGGDGIPVELFQILKDDAVKVRHSICQQIWNTQQWPQDQKRSVFIPIPKKDKGKGCSNYHTIPLISRSSSVQFSRSVASDSLQPHESQHARPPCPSPTPGVHSDSCSSSQ